MSKSLSFIEDLKRSTWTMHPLQAHVVNNGVCPKCHTKTLRATVNGNGHRWKVCDTCNSAFYIGPPDQL